MGTLYAAAHGGVAAYSFAGSPAVNPFVLRGQRRPVPDFEHYLRATASLDFHHDLVFRNRVNDELASFGAFYDNVALFGALPEDIAVWQRRGYVADWAEGTALVAHFEACTIDLVGPAVAEGPPQSFDVRAATGNLAKRIQVAPVVGDDGLAHYRLPGAPCGAVLVHPSWEEPTAGRLAHRCSNANADGDLAATVTHSSAAIVCAVQERAAQ